MTAKPPDSDIITAIRSSAGHVPDTIAIQATSSSLTYRQLVAGIDQVASLLRTRGIGVGDRVAVHHDRSPDLVVALLGVLAAGAAYVPIDSEEPRRRAVSILTDADPRCLLGNSAGAALAADAGVPYANPLAEVEGWSTACATLQGELPMPAEHDAAYVVYTSGSTGTPKGVVVEHGSLRNYLAWALKAVPWVGGGVPLFASIAFDHAVTCFLPPLMIGETLYLLPSLRGGRDLGPALLTGHRYSFVKITPSHVRLLNADERASLGAATELLMFGGERLARDLVADVRRANNDLEVLNHYGPTEATVGCCVYAVPHNPPRDVPIGRPLPGVEILVVDTDDAPVDPLVAGELLVGGLAPARGYFDREEETQERFVERQDHPGRWYRTGDIVRTNQDGDLEYLGRLDDQVKILGHRVEPGEIEHALRACPGVRDAVVVVVPGDPSELVAAVVTDDATLGPHELRAQLRGELPPALVPARVGVVSALPVTARGKIDRAAVLALVPAATISGVSLEGTDRDEDRPAPRSGDRGSGGRLLRARRRLTGRRGARSVGRARDGTPRGGLASFQPSDASRTGRPTFRPRLIGGG